MMKKALIQCLQQLQGAQYGTKLEAGQNHAHAHKLLDLIFQLGKERTTFNEEEKKEIGPLLANALNPIKFSIEHVYLKYRTRLESSVLRKRSALEFLFEDYGKFPAGEVLLVDKFVEVNLRESTRLLDTIIEKWADAEDSDEGATDTESQLPGIPKSHAWWFR